MSMGMWPVSIHCSLLSPTTTSWTCTTSQSRAFVSLLIYSIGPFFTLTALLFLPPPFSSVFRPSLKCKTDWAESIGEKCVASGACGILGILSQVLALPDLRDSVRENHPFTNLLDRKYEEGNETCTVCHRTVTWSMPSVTTNRSLGRNRILDGSNTPPQIGEDKLERPQKNLLPPPGQLGGIGYPLSRTVEVLLRGGWDLHTIKLITKHWGR